MAPNTRMWARSIAVLAVAGVVLAACGSSTTTKTTTTKSAIGPVSTTVKGAYGSLPPSDPSKATMGGTVTIGMIAGQTPNWIFPITIAADSSVFTIDQFQDFMWRPLWWSPTGAIPAVDYTQSIGQKPVFSNNNKTVTITLNSGWKWNDGSPVTSTDAEFFIDLLEAAVKESPANYGDYTPGLFPDNITSMSAPNATTLVLNFNKTYNQNFLFLDQLGVITPLPAQAWAKESASGPVVTDWSNPKVALKIYNYLAGLSKDEATYATNPIWKVADGPYVINSFDPSTGANSLIANTKYTGPVTPHIHEVQDVYFTSTTALFNALRTSSVDVGQVDYSDLPSVSSITPNYYVWGYPDFGFSYVAYNFEDATGDFDNIIKQLYIRQAIAHLQDEAGLIASKGVFDGAAGQAYGPTPAVPPSPFAPANALMNPYPYSVSAASTLLSSHGWKVVPQGQTTCVKPGTAADECGAGIPAGTPLKWNLIYGNSPAVLGEQDVVLASTAKTIGIQISLSEKTFNYIIGNLSDVGNPTNKDIWAMQDFGGFTNSLYPTTNELFNFGGSYDIGGYDSSTANTDISNSVSSLNNSAVETEIGYITAQQPGLFQPNPDLIYAFSKKLDGPPNSFEDATQYVYSPEYWYFTS